MSTWIFLRGLTRESRHWGDFPELFRQAIPGAWVHTPDLPGNGTLHAQRSPGRVEEMVDDLRARLLAHGVPPPYRILAMSLGAMVTVAWAARHPDDLRGCVLINTSLRPHSPFYHRLRPGRYPRLLKLALLGGSAEEWERTIFQFTSRQPGLPAELIAAWIAYRREFSVGIANALRQLLAAARYRAPLAPPRPPLLILASQRDALVDSACSRHLAHAWGTAFAEHPTAGHDLPLDAGPWVVQQVQRWLLLAAAPAGDEGQATDGSRNAAMPSAITNP